MVLREKLLYAIGIEVEGAKKGLKDVRRSVLEAEGSFGKLKAGAGAALSGLAANAGLFAVAAGGALLTAGVKAVGVFGDMAKAAIDGAAATGLNTEQMSRWIAVADDFEVSTDQLVTGLGRIAKTLDDDKWKKYGIATRDATGQAREANDVLLDAFDMLGRITNETERATVGNDLFGKGYKSLAPLVGKTRAEYEQYLGAVEKGQVITAEEAEKAEKTRLAMDKLHDSMQELTLAAGQLASPAMADVADGLTAIAEGAAEAGDIIENNPGLRKLFGVWNPVTGFGGGIIKGVKELRDAWSGSESDSDRFNDSILRGAVAAKTTADGVTALGGVAGETADELVDLGDRAANSGPKIGDMAGALDDAEQHLADLNEEARDNALGILADAAKAVGDALDESFGSLEDDLGSLDLLDDITDQFDTIAEAQKNATDPKGVRDYNREVRRLQGMLLDYLGTVDDIPPDKKTEIIAQIRTGDIETLKATLDELTKDRFINITPVVLHDAFHSVNASFTPGSAPSAPTFQGVSAAPNQPVSTDARTIINYFPVGTTPTTQFIDRTIDDRRNGAR